MQPGVGYCSVTYRGNKNCEEENSCKKPKVTTPAIIPIRRQVFIGREVRRYRLDLNNCPPTSNLGGLNKQRGQVIFPSDAAQVGF